MDTAHLNKSLNSVTETAFLPTGMLTSIDRKNTPCHSDLYTVPYDPDPIFSLILS